jgi:hypothetical protein
MSEPTPKKYKVTIHSGEDAGDKGDVFLSHNFRSMLVQRDVEVELDECFVEVLKHSVIETTAKKDGVEVPVKIPRFAYNVSA